MQWISRLLTISLTLLALTSPSLADRVRWCLLCEIQETPAVDTLCTMQGRMIMTPADSAAIKALPVELQRRIVANETRYRCKCQKWQHPVCGAPPK